jgi:hypothetical protein
MAVALPEVDWAIPRLKIWVSESISTWMGAKFWPATCTATCALVVTWLSTLRPWAVAAPLALWVAPTGPAAPPAGVLASAPAATPAPAGEVQPAPAQAGAEVATAMPVLVALAC